MPSLPQRVLMEEALPTPSLRRCKFQPQCIGCYWVSVATQRGPFEGAYKRRLLAQFEAAALGACGIFVIGTPCMILSFNSESLVVLINAANKNTSKQSNIQLTNLRYS